MKLFLAFGNKISTCQKLTFDYVCFVLRGIKRDSMRQVTNFCNNILVQRIISDYSDKEKATYDLLRQVGCQQFHLEEIHGGILQDKFQSHDSNIDFSEKSE